MKLIQVTEAAEKLGVSRQTLENWGKNGTLRIRAMGKRPAPHWVDADTIDALGDTMQDIEKTRQQLQQEQQQLRDDYNKEREIRKDIERELYLTGKFGSEAICRKDFYQSIPIMLCVIGVLNQREAQIMGDVIGGRALGSIAEEYGLSRARISQIFFKGCQKARRLSNIKEQLDELKELKAEMECMKKEMKVMSQDLKVQQMAEQELQKMEEAERIKHIEETDGILKLYSTKLVDCNFSVRALNCFRAVDIETIGDLAQCSRTWLLKYRNFGKKTLLEVERFLSSQGLDFDTDVDKIYRDRIALRLQESDNNN